MSINRRTSCISQKVSRSSRPASEVVRHNGSLTDMEQNVKTSNQYETARLEESVGFASETIDSNTLPMSRDEVEPDASSGIVKLHS